MAKTLNALIYPSAPTVIAERRMIDVATIPPNKVSWWRPIVEVGNDAFDPLTQKKTGPVTTIEANQVVDTYTVVSLTEQEISDNKDAALAALNGSLYAALAKALLAMENDNRIIKAKINALITEQGSTTPPFTAGQASQINMAQLKAGFKALL